MLGFSLEKKKKSWFSLLYCSFLSILLVERQSLEKTSKAGEKLEQGEIE